MSKSEGRKIAIKFNKALIGDVPGLTPIPVHSGIEFFTPTGVMTASNSYNATYAPSKLIDNDDATNWYTNLSMPQWFQIQLSQPEFIDGFKWKVSSTSPNGFNVQGSNDNVTWNTLYTGNSENSSGWKEFQWDMSVAYMYIRWNIVSMHSAYLQIFGLQLKKRGGNEIAFTVTGQEYNYVPGGQLVSKSYKVKSVELHAIEPNTVVLTFDPIVHFNNVVGDLTVSYNSLIGDLAGANGLVESFESVFTPTELIKKDNPNDLENVGIKYVTPVGTLIALVYSDVNAKNENIRIKNIAPVASLTTIYYADNNSLENIDIFDITPVGVLSHI